MVENLSGPPLEQKLRRINATLNGQSVPRSMADLLAKPPAYVPRLLEPSLIVRQGITVLAAPTKVGKTNFWLHAAWALSSGANLWGRFAAPEPVSVLMVQLELSEATMFERLRILQEKLGWEDAAQDRFFLRCERSIHLDRRGGPDKLVKMIADCPTIPEVVILDSYNAAVMGDPDKSGEARRALHALREVQDKTDVAWAVTAEIRKAPAGGRIRFTLDDLKGSNDVAYDADTVLMFRPVDTARRRLAIHFLASRHATEEPPEGLHLLRQGLSFELTEGPTDEVEEQVEKVLREHLKGGDERWRSCLDAVRTAGLQVRDQVVGDVRRRLLAGAK